jgi:hypothetical protein
MRYFSRSCWPTTATLLRDGAPLTDTPDYREILYRGWMYVLLRSAGLWAIKKRRRVVL